MPLNRIKLISAPDFYIQNISFQEGYSFNDVFWKYIFTPQKS
jgi:hypothetical protein